MCLAPKERGLLFVTMAIVSKIHAIDSAFSLQHLVSTWYKKETTCHERVVIVCHALIHA